MHSSLLFLLVTSIIASPIQPRNPGAQLVVPSTMPILNCIRAPCPGSPSEPYPYPSYSPQTQASYKPTPTPSPTTVRKPMYTLPVEKPSPIRKRQCARTETAEVSCLDSSNTLFHCDEHGCVSEEELKKNPSASKTVSWVLGGSTGKVASGKAPGVLKGAKVY